MEEPGDPQMKRERPGPYGHPMPGGLQHMPPAETVASYSYQHPPPATVGIQPHWNPTPSPYEGGVEHRPPQPPPPPPPPPSAGAPDLPPHPSPYPPQHFPPPPPHTHAPDPAYARPSSNPATTRSPPSSHPAHYPPPAPAVNGSAPEHQYYPPPPEYARRPPYGPPEGQPNGTQPPPLHVTTNHEMMPSHPQSAPPLQYPQSAGPTPSAGYWAPGYAEYHRPRKPVRAAQACDPCRQRKAKCDEGRPTCTHCKDNHLTCVYRDVPPQKSEKQVIAINDKLETLSGHVEQLLEKWKTHEDRLNRVLEMHEASERRGASTMAASATDERKPARADMMKTSNQPADDALTDESSHQPFRVWSVATPQESAVKDPTSRGKDRTAGTSTAAAHILSWPVIKALIPKDLTPSYVMDTESERGLIRLYGCGEGEDKGDGHDGAPSPATSSSSGPYDELGRGLSPSGVWGTGQFPPAAQHGTARKAREHPGGLSPNGGLNLDAEVVDRYHQSYLDNMHKLHPFLETKVLRKMVHAFKRKYSWDFRLNPTVATSVGIKRKREGSDSPQSIEEYGVSHPMQRTNSRPFTHLAPIEHSVSNAIILLVLGLGKICAHRDPLPAPIPSVSMRTSTPHTVYSDLPITSSSSAPASPHAPHGSTNGAAGPTATGATNPQCKNMDVIPGLAYFTKAADILGELPGGVDVSHVQANLLAGLYMGQLARILPSHWYIRNACTACQTLIQSTPYRENRMTPARRNLINFAFWSCLQLESDLLAEMDIPASGIISKEGAMEANLPTEMTLPDDERGEGDWSRIEEMHLHYLYQISLRRMLNDGVKYVYNEDRINIKPAQTAIEILGYNLEQWRSLLRSWAWDDDDFESPDINTARLRGKYYGAKYIMHRPALYWALHFGNSNASSSTPRSQPSHSPAAPALGSELPSPAVANAHYGHRDMRPPPNKYFEPLEPWIIAAAEKCVHAAIRSTTSFDKVPQRLVITNIFGTAHAQFGNVLVLSATYNSSHPQLNSLVDESKLRFLLDRTINFLQKHEAISPTLGIDAKILIHVRNKVFSGGGNTNTTPANNLLHQYGSASASSSFSSNR